MSEMTVALAIEAARLLGLTLAPEHLEGVAANLDLLGQHAARVLAEPLPHRIEPAPVFRP